MGEEERVIVSGTCFVAGWALAAGSGFAVGGGVVGFLDWAACRLRKKPPSVTSWLWPGSGLGERRGAGEVGSAGGVGRECWDEEKLKIGARVAGSGRVVVLSLGRSSAG
jgi:hypothetical protein